VKQLDLFADAAVVPPRTYGRMAIREYYALPMPTDVERLELQHPRLHFAQLARIEIAQHTDKHWMWATSLYGGNGGRGYCVHPKWGNFTYSRLAAIDAAIEEIRASLPQQDLTSAERGVLITWIGKLMRTVGSS